MLVAGRVAAEETTPAVAAAEAGATHPETIAAQPSLTHEAAPAAKDSPAAEGLAPLRLQVDARLGLGYVSVRSNAGDQDVIVSGLTMPWGLSVGLSLTRSLVVFGEISDTPMLFFNSETSPGANTFDLYGGGLGLKVYLTPNYFLSAAASIARLQLQRSNDYLEVSHWGAMGGVRAGGEWPISPSWSVGVAGEYQFASVQLGLLGRYLFYPPDERELSKALSTFAFASYHQSAGPAPGSVESLAPPSSNKGLVPFGLYLDARVGVGALWSSVGDGFSITGASIPVAVSVGIKVSKDLVVFAELSDIHMLHPARNLANPQIDPGDAQLYGLDLYGAGLGLKYYLTPRAYFLSGSFSLARLRYDGAYTRREEVLRETSHRGPLARISAGREWPISPSWSLGVAGELQLGRMKTGPSFNDYVPNTFGDDSYTIKGLSLLALATFNPPAQQDAVDSGIGGLPVGHHKHDGVYVNASLGAGWLWLENLRQEQQHSDPNYRASGQGALLSLSVGYAFADRFVVFGELSGLQAHQAADLSEFTTLQWYGFGPGLRYYAMPANVFISGSLLMSRTAVYNSARLGETDALNRSSKWGATGQLSVGKEWWLASDLGVGVATEFGLGKMTGNDPWLTYTTKQFALLASVTFN